MPASGNMELTAQAAAGMDRRLEVAVQNRATVEALYKALLGQGHMDKVALLIASDLEYWFHGPPGRQHMMRILTGESAPNRAGFRFEPRSVTAIGDCVITEGWEGQAYWVHVWTLKNGFITKFREYFNTWLVVKDLRPTPAVAAVAWVEEDQKKVEKMTLWQSQPRDLYRRSLPGLLLAI
ncbi:hypothetical protein K1719_013129 [Acacia pycnantha]|nr:hypothetical protein K1719_013129 [Acacia pycnantha]